MNLSFWTIDIINVIITNANLVVINDINKNCFLKSVREGMRVSQIIKIVALYFRVLDFFYVDLLFDKIDSWEIFILLLYRRMGIFVLSFVIGVLGWYLQ